MFDHASTAHVVSHDQVRTLGELLSRADAPEAYVMPVSFGERHDGLLAAWVPDDEQDQPPRREWLIGNDGTLVSGDRPE